jgi:hypothetical protein
LGRRNACILPLLDRLDPKGASKTTADHGRELIVVELIAAKTETCRLMAALMAVP